MTLKTMVTFQEDGCRYDSVSGIYIAIVEEIHKNIDPKYQG